jgi:hypothetical protein
MKTIGFPKTWLLALAPLALSSCGGGDGSDDGASSQCVGGKCDEVAPENFSCKELSDESGRGAANVLEQLADPFAEFALKRGGDGCPENFDEVMERLKANDAENCGSDGGMESRLISEAGPFESVANPLVRSVTTRTCNGRQDFELIFSLFGVSASRLPGGAEVMAFDPEAGEFNYYEFDGRGEITFFGSSSDFVKGQGGRCKNCHAAGGLVMKELRNPWMHWERLDRVAGPIIDAHKDDLGSSKFSRGSNMEFLTTSGNSKWNDTKVLLLTNPDNGLTTQDMLRPLFCGAQVNLDTAATSANSEPTRIPEGFFAHCKLFGASGCTGTHFGESGGVQIAAGTYNAAIDAAGQILPKVSGQKDTVFGMPFIEPSLEDIDYVDKLVKAGVLDDDFVLDVLAVDFTRPVFSQERCDLLQFAPDWAALESPVEPMPSDDGGMDTGGSDGAMDGGTDGGMDGGTGGAVDTGGAADGGGDDPGTCCAAHDGTGCSNATIQQCVCDFDAFCCETQWDATCVEEAGSQCGVTCTAPRKAELSDPRVMREATIANVRAGFIANLQAANPDPGSAAGQLLASLQAADDAAAHRQRVKDFVAACNARDDAAFMSDALQVVHNQRRTAAGLAVFEFAETMPDIDSSPMSGAHLDPATCELVVD